MNHFIMDHNPPDAAKGYRTGGGDCRELRPGVISGRDGMHCCAGVDDPTYPWPLCRGSANGSEPTGESTRGIAKMEISICTPAADEMPDALFTRQRLHIAESVVEDNGRDSMFIRVPNGQLHCGVVLVRRL